MVSNPLEEGVEVEEEAGSIIIGSLIIMEGGGEAPSPLPIEAGAEVEVAGEVIEVEAPRAPEGPDPFPLGEGDLGPEGALGGQGPPLQGVIGPGLAKLGPDLLPPSQEGISSSNICTSRTRCTTFQTQLAKSRLMGKLLQDLAAQNSAIQELARPGLAHFYIKGPHPVAHRLPQSPVLGLVGSRLAKVVAEEGFRVPLMPHFRPRSSLACGLYQQAQNQNKLQEVV